MKKMIFFIFLMISSLELTVFATDEPSELYAQSAVLMDADSGRILFAKNGEEKKANASTTKILTAILALEHGDMNAIVTVSKEASSQPEVHLGMREGEEYHIIDLLYSLMLESHNDSAVAIAQEIAGSVEKFADLMNEKALEIGCDDTYFITPNGLDAVDSHGIHGTTATDLARILAYCVMKSPQKELFREITGTMNYSFTTVGGERSFSCNNHNQLLSMMTGAFSGKTGFTNDAGYCYVGALESEGRTFIIAILASGWPNNRSYKWSDANKLLEYGMEHYLVRFLEPQEQILEVSTLNSEKDMTELRLKEGEEVKVLMREDEKVDIMYDYPKVIYAPMDKDTLVGCVRYSIDDEIYKIDSVFIGENLEKLNFFHYFLRKT